jgi:hypothetical protein
MNKFITRALISLVVSGFAINSYARDISNEQRNASKAREVYNQEKWNYETLSAQIKAQEKRIAEEQERLEELKLKQSKAKSNADASKSDLDAKSQILDQAWSERNK